MDFLGLRAGGGLRWIRPLLLFVPVVLLLVACRQGVGLDWDAVVYLSAAESFADTGRLISYSGYELTTFAPGLPTLVGLLLKTGVDFNVIGIVIAVIAVLTTMVCTYAVAKGVLGSASLAWTVVALVGLSVSTVRVFAMLKTEAPFTALVMLTLTLCLWAIRSGRAPLWWLLSVAATVSIATTFRYIGFTLIPMAALASLLALWPRSKGRSIVLAVATGVAASVGLLVVALRNIHLGTAPLGPRSPSGLTGERVLVDTLHVLGSYIIPSDSAETAQVIGGVAVVGLIMLGALAAVRSRSVPASFLVVFVCGFIAVLLYSEFATVIQMVSERLLAPVFPSIVILAVTGFDWLLRPSTPRADDDSLWFRPARVVALGLLAVTMIASGFSSGTFSLTAGQKGMGYNSVASRMSPTANAARELPAHVGVAAMNGPRIYMATRRTPIHLIPITNHFSPPKARQWGIHQLKARVDSGRVGYLVYFKRDRRDAVVTPKELAESGLKLRKVAQYRDGAIWEPVR